MMVPLPESRPRSYCGKPSSQIYTEVVKEEADTGPRLATLLAAVYSPDCVLVHLLPLHPMVRSTLSVTLSISRVYGVLLSARFSLYLFFYTCTAHGRYRANLFSSRALDRRWTGHDNNDDSGHA